MFSPRIMSRRAAGLLAVLAAVFLQAQPAPAQTIGPDTVIATVNGVPITGADLALAGSEFADQLAQVPPERRDTAVLDLVINMRLATASMAPRWRSTMARKAAASPRPTLARSAASVVASPPDTSRAAAIPG